MLGIRWESFEIKGVFRGRWEVGTRERGFGEFAGCGDWICVEALMESEERRHCLDLQRFMLVIFLGNVRFFYGMLNLARIISKHVSMEKLGILKVHEFF